MTNNKEKYDVIIIGGGTCGITLGQLLAKQGKKVVIVEKTFFHVFILVSHYYQQQRLYYMS